MSFLKKIVQSLKEFILSIYIPHLSENFAVDKVNIINEKQQLGRVQSEMTFPRQKMCYSKPLTSMFTVKPRSFCCAQKELYQKKDNNTLICNYCS